MKTINLKIGDTLIAKDVCKMEDEPFQETLTIGREYTITEVYDTHFNIIDDEGSVHGFWHDTFHEVFYYDKIVEEVRNDLLNRSQTGIQKYGTTLDRTDIDLEGWLQHAYEETIDKALYLKRAIKELKNK